MTTVISSNLVLSAKKESDNKPILAYENIANFSNISCTSETQANPCTNMVNPATAYKWTASGTATQTITINAQGREVDYIGIARHNLNQLGLTVSIRFNGVTVVPAQAISSKQAILFGLNLATPTTIEIIISGATTAPSIAVLYVGKAMELQRNNYVGHTPINMGRDRKTINGMSENGQYLGEMVVSESFTTQVSLNNLTPDWYRANLEPFFSLKPRVPCFWAWRRESYPDEVGFCWVEGDPRPQNALSNGMMSVSWNFRGIA